MRKGDDTRDRVIELRRQGLNSTAVGRALGISRQRVAVIVKGLKTEYPDIALRPYATERKCEACRKVLGPEDGGRRTRFCPTCRPAAMSEAIKKGKAKVKPATEETT